MGRRENIDPKRDRIFENQAAYVRLPPPPEGRELPVVSVSAKHDAAGRRPEGPTFPPRGFALSPRISPRPGDPLGVLDGSFKISGRGVTVARDPPKVEERVQFPSPGPAFAPSEVRRGKPATIRGGAARPCRPVRAGQATRPSIRFRVNPAYTETRTETFRG